MKRYLGFLLIIVTVFFVACGDSGSSNPVGSTPETFSVTLLSPVNGATYQDTSLTFSWSGTDSTYDVYLGTNSLNLGKIASDLKTTSYTKSGLSKGTIYYWKVIGKTGSASGESVVRSFITKIDVNLVSPDSGALDLNRSLTFKWSGKADKYDIYFGLDSLNLNTVVRDLSTTSYTKTDFNTSTTYYWKVVGKTDGEVDTSNVWKFTTAKIYVSPLSPSEGATAQDTKVTLIWRSNADKYTIYMGTDNNSFDEIKADLTDTFFEKSGLSKNTTYYWKLIASGDGKTVFSENRSFTTKINVELSSPANQALNQNTSVDLTWACIASSYDVYLGTDSSNLTTAIATDISTKTFTKSGLTEGITYYWKVVGKKGSELDTSDVWKFTTKISVSLSSPADGATYIPTDTTFTWSGTATSYDFYLGTSQTSLTKIASDLTIPSFSKNGLDEVTTYYWKVVGKKDNQTAESAIRSFKTNFSVSLSSPVNNTIYQDTSITLSWNGTASTYDVYFGTNSSSLDKIVSDVATKSYTKGGLSYGTTYYWKVIGKDGNATVESSTFKFETKPISFTNSIGIEFVLVENGTFSMGSNDGANNEKPVHKVTITKGYYIGKYEVTQAQWIAVMGYNPSVNIGDNLPVEKVTWDTVQAFITKLNKNDGNYVYRLPTEAEWEFAARGGNKSQNYTYAGSNNIDEVAWYYANSSSKTHEVGTKVANELGIYDMSGNVWEWCNDLCGTGEGIADYGSSDPVTDPSGAATGWARILRSGAFCHGTNESRVTYRGYNFPSYDLNDGNPNDDYDGTNAGFRLVGVHK